jgi:serine/threonine-protein kinase
MEFPSTSGPPDPSAFSTRPKPASPKRIGRYELRFELASGGMANVYLARAEGAPGFQKLIALKRIHSHLATEKDYVEMFLDEARIASRITHANVCSVFDFGEADGEYYIAMEYLVGEPLSRVQRRVMANADQRSSALLPARMARVIAGACEGLHAAHELKDSKGELLRVVHRDVSAENLFVTYDGLVQVVDFGIAHARQRVHHTSAGQVKGTFPYMAPEQMTAAVVDRRVDVWALGAVLWELLTLRRLFLRDTDVNTMYAVLSSEIRPPSDYRKEVPPELDSIVLRALQRNPDERWPTARQMGTALRRFLAKQEELVGPAELADWMAELFPDGELRKQQLMEIARTTDETNSPEAPQRADQRSGIRIPRTKKNRTTPTAPPLPASLLVLMIGIATVVGVLALDWLR